MGLSPQHTIAMAKDWLVKQSVRKGAACPCCTQFVKVYKRKLNAGMARTLIWLVCSTNPGEWLDVPKSAPRYVLRSNEHGKLQHWGLLQQRPQGAAKVKHFWMATPLGRDFVHQRTTVPGHVYLYNNQCLGFTNEQSTIVEALGKRFDYAELMKAAVS